MTSSNGNIFRVTGPLCGEFTGPGEYPAQRPVARSFVFSFICTLSKRLSKQSYGWWFETQSRPLWRHCNDATQLSNIDQWKTTSCKWNEFANAFLFDPNYAYENRRNWWLNLQIRRFIFYSFLAARGGLIWLTFLTNETVRENSIVMNFSGKGVTDRFNHRISNLVAAD